jgi:hypothetical protein
MSRLSCVYLARNMGLLFCDRQHLFYGNWDV